MGKASPERGGSGERTGSDALLYSRIANTIRTEIALGQFPVDSWLPTEAKLCERFGVSRHTVREALRILGDLGLVERRQGAGTRVIARAEPSDYVHSLHTLSEIFQYTRDTRLEIGDVSIVEVSPQTGGDDIPAAPDSRWLKITGVRRTTATREDVSYSIVFVHLRFAPALHDIRDQTGPVYATIEERTGELVIEARQVITGGTLPAAAADALGVPQGTAGIRVIRRYLDIGGGPMLTSINWHLADSFTYAITLRRDAGI
ncbi:GntR family transcriptional regulator [Enterovirga rhinocerotis]|uniref:GntR family transcriptional regulator n=1 Tax=Enterovirga rhinocerotis TaxID=1339210 RepID=A0A4R7C6S7_9HYPH|nr:GntR family transcriptional regulator [Enterovirga rhinocerotis]TDR93652.1 GntR family transcriptional regulator [Enterovirga rhinocerotis]